VRSLAKDGQTWRVGTNAELAWIADGTTGGTTINQLQPGEDATPPRYPAF